MYLQMQVLFPLCESRKRVALGLRSSGARSPVGSLRRHGAFASTKRYEIAAFESSPAGFGGWREFCRDNRYCGRAIYAPGISYLAEISGRNDGLRGCAVRLRQ